MANTRSGNIHYVDSTGTLRTDQNIRVTQIILTSTSAAGEIVLQDASSNTLLDLKVENGISKPFPFYVPIVFANGLKVSTLTTCKAMIFYTQGSGGNI